MVKLIISGYAVQKEKGSNFFLSRAKAFIEHPDKDSFLGVQCAYVHTKETILKGGDWVTDNILIYPASYSPKENFTAVGSSCFTYEEFLENHQPFQVS